MKVISLFIPFATAITQLTLIECGKCYHLIKTNYYNKKLVYHCKLAIIEGRCDSYKRAYRDTSIYF